MTKPKPRTPAAVAIGAPLIAAAAAATAGAVALNRAGFPRRVGASKFEARTEMPGDDLLDEVVKQVDGARLIPAEPEQVWNWLATLGREEAGLFSSNARQRLSSNGEVEYSLEVDDPFWVHPKLKMRVVAAMPHRKLVLTSDPEADEPPVTWGILLRHVPRPGRKVHTRLRIRERHGVADTGRKPAGVGTAVNTWRLLSRLDTLARVQER